MDCKARARRLNENDIDIIGDFEYRGRRPPAAHRRERPTHEGSIGSQFDWRDRSNQEVAALGLFDGSRLQLRLDDWTDATRGESRSPLLYNHSEHHRRTTDENDDRSTY